jgi:hypothetical protein
MHFVAAIAGFYLCTVIFSRIQVGNAPESFNTGCFPAFNGCLSDSGYTVIFFFDESPVCNKMRYNLEQTMITDNPDVRFFSVDVNGRQQTDFQIPVSGVPTTLILKDKKEVVRVTGLVSQGNMKKIYTRKIISKQR